MQRLTTLACVLGVFAACSVASAQEDKTRLAKITALPRIAPEIHQSLANREFEAAIEQLNEAIAGGKHPSRDYLYYLLGRAQTELRRFDAALQTYETLEKEFPASTWVARSRFGRADVHARRRDYAKAGEIYRKEADRLLSAGRRDELAGIYLEFANRYFDGIPSKDPAAKPVSDYKQALVYFQEALKLNPSAKVRHVIDLRIARSHYELGQNPQAIAAYTQYLASYVGERVKGEDRAAPKLEAEARFQLGRAMLKANLRSQARRTWQDLLALEGMPAAAPDLAAEAMFQLARTHAIPNPPTISDLELGVASHEKFLRTHPKHKLAARAEYEIAQSYVHHGRYDQAIERLTKLIGSEAYVDSQYVAEGRRLLGGSYFAQKKFNEAIKAWKEFLEAHPSNAAWSNVQRTVIDAEFETAAEQQRKKNYEAARKLWETFLNKYPLDSRAPMILLAFGEMKYDAAVEQQEARKKDGDDAQADRKLPPKAISLFEAAIADWTRLVSKYPGANEASQAAYRIGGTLEDRLGRLPEALKAYKSVKGQASGFAKKRINRLTAKQLELITERKYRTNEKATVRVKTRNIEKVTVSVYRIDMVDYFRKMHLATGVEALDIALIDPDESWEYKIEDYEAYRGLSNDVVIPVDGAGISAVTVSGENLEATTMVVVSDIDIVVKSSRNELFVFAQNMLTRKPAADASLLISDGSEIFAEETTGADGVVQKSFKQLKSVADLRVFAIREGHAASTVTSLNGLSFAVGLAPKGYLYTDRPAYRAGQLVNLKGIVRWVENDEFMFKEGEKYQLDIYDSQGRVVHTSEVSLGKFGAFASHFTLPESAPQGDYRVHVHQPAGKQSYETVFTVHEYKLEPIRLSIDLSRKVYYRGEKIEGAIQLRYYYGTPLADRSIQYRLADGPLKTATTNAKGEVAFEFETQRFSESQALSIMVAYPERNLNTSETVQLATRGFNIGVSALRNVYISGETFDATVKVSDPAGSPVGAELELEILESTVVAGRTGERSIEKIKLKSDEKTGESRRTLRIDDSGKYILRVSGVDQFGNRISGQKTVMISGDDDSIRLRILAQKQHYDLGETAKVRLHWREDPALALVTYEGAQVLGYQLVQLKKGANPLTIPLDSKLAPNFRLAVTVMEGDRFHQASSEIRVARKLKITLKTNKNTLAPGEALTANLLVTDLQGKPVSAEMSLGLVQKNLLDYFGEVAGGVDDFFGSGYRKPSVRATASCTFRYLPQTRAVNAALLAEAERVRLKEMEAESRRGLAENVANWGVEIAGGAGVGNDRAGALANALRERVNETLDRIDDDDDGDARRDYLDGYNQLFSQGRFREAEIVAKQLQELAPDDVTSEALRWNARRARGVAEGKAEWREYSNFRGERPFVTSIVPTLGQQATGGAQVSGQQSFGYAGRAGQRGMQQGGQGQQQQELASQLQSTTRNGNANGQVVQLDVRRLFGSESGEITASSQRLSLIISQTQSIEPQVAFDLYEHMANTKVTVAAVNGDGKFQVINGLSAKALEAFGASGMQVLPRMQAAETGYWNPVIVTDADGKATVTFHLPERSTAWKLQARGVNAQTLSGQAEVEIVAKKDLFGELKSPLAFYEGDKAHVIAEVHNSVVKKGEEITVVLTATIGERATTQTKKVKSNGPGVIEVSFPIDVTAGEEVKFELQVNSGERADKSDLAVKIRPYGLPVYATVSGVAAQSTIALLESNKELAVEKPELEILIGPSVNRALLDAVIGRGVSPLESSLAIQGNQLERSVSDVLGGLALLKMIGGARDASPEAKALSGRVQGAVAQLITSQRSDGGWSWSGETSARQSDRYLSSRVVWAISQARSSGFAVSNDTFNKSVQFLRTAYTSTTQSDREAQAILLHGLAEAGVGDFALANRLYRERNSLSPSGLVHLALVLDRLDRKEMAGELIALVKISVDPRIASGQMADSAVLRCVPWMQTGVELRALYLLALQRVSPNSDKISPLANWLLAARRGARWTPEKVNGPAVAALADWFTKTKVINEKYVLSVFVNDELVEKLTIDPSVDSAKRLAVPSKLLVKDKPQRINFDLEGRGTFSYSAILTGFVPADKIVSSTKDWVVTRIHEPALRMLDGKPIPRGFGIARRYSQFRNPLTQLPMGERGEVTLHIHRNNIRGVRNEQFDYLVVVEPLPAGAMVLTESLRGDFERYEISPGAITFFVGDKPRPGDIHYTIAGYLPGSYRAAPTVVRSYYRPDRIAVSSAKKLEMLARGEKSKDAYRLSPVELFEFGKRYHAKADHENASQYLTTLFNGWQLDEKVYQQLVQLLFKSSLELGKDSAIVEYFEIIKERYPEVELPYASILRVGAAYRKLGEYERSYLVFRATVEGRFQRESQIAGFLDSRGEFLRSVQVVEKLVKQYPAESYVATATYSLAGEVYGKAAAASADAKLKEAKVTRVDLIAATIHMLEHFLSAWPKDPAADQASFSMASALLDLEKYDEAIASCERFAERYPDSKLLDAYWYVIGFSQFALSKHEQALEMCRKVATWTRKNPQTGRKEEAANKWEAIYIMGQVYHSLGQAAKAIDEYGRVEKRFADAKEAIDFFTRKEIELPEITSVKPGKEVEVKLTFRNLPTAGVKVYRIDLLKFGLMQRNLDQITAINLAGIRPYHALDLELGDGKDYRDREQTLKLPLKEEGAYLVVCRAESLYTSGLVLVSPLELAVQEDLVSGRVRVTVKDAVKAQFVRDVQVKVIGTRNSEFNTGETDLRGIFVADAIGGRSTVIARLGGDRYAFYRGKTELRPQEAKPNAPAAAASPQQPAPTKGKGGKDLLLDNIRGSNSMIIEEQQKSYKSLINNNDSGVKAKAAY